MTRKLTFVADRKDPGNIVSISKSSAGTCIFVPAEGHGIKPGQTWLCEDVAGLWRNATKRCEAVRVMPLRRFISAEPAKPAVAVKKVEASGLKRLRFGLRENKKTGEMEMQASEKTSTCIHVYTVGKGMSKGPKDGETWDFVPGRRLYFREGEGSKLDLQICEVSEFVELIPSAPKGKLEARESQSKADNGTLDDKAVRKFGRELARNIRAAKKGNTGKADLDLDDKSKGNRSSRRTGNGYDLLRAVRGMSASEVMAR